MAKRREQGEVKRVVVGQRVWWVEWKEGGLDIVSAIPRKVDSMFVTFLRKGSMALDSERFFISEQWAKVSMLRQVVTRHKERVAKAKASLSDAKLALRSALGARS